MINLTIDNKAKDFELDNFPFKKIFEESLEKMERGGNIEIELIFVVPEEIQRLNKEFRKKDQPTDILSFPQEQFEVEENILGTIVICPQIAKERKEDFEQLAKHGLLHLLGYDHETNEEEWDKAAKIIDCTF